MRIQHDKRYRRHFGGGQITFITNDKGEIVGGSYEAAPAPEVLEDMPEVGLCKVEFSGGIVEYVPRELMEEES